MSRLVTVKAIKKNTWSGFQRFKNTKDSLSPMFDSSGTLITGLTKEDEERLGKILNVDLSKHSPYWHEYRVIMTEREKVFNPENPEHEVAIKFLLADRRIANSQEGLDAGEFPYARYIIYDAEVEAKSKNKEFSLKRKAVDAFNKLSLDDMVGILKLYPGFVNTTSVSSDVVEATLFELLEKNPEKFLGIVEDKFLEMKIFLKELVQFRVLRKNKAAFYYGEDPIGHDEESTITYLNDPLNQALKVQLGVELKKAKVSK